MLSDFALTFSVREWKEHLLKHFTNRPGHKQAEKCRACPYSFYRLHKRSIYKKNPKAGRKKRFGARCGAGLNTKHEKKKLPAMRPGKTSWEIRGFIHIVSIVYIREAFIRRTQRREGKRDSGRDAGAGANMKHEKKKTSRYV